MSKNSLITSYLTHCFRSSQSGHLVIYHIRLRPLDVFNDDVWAQDGRDHSLHAIEEIGFMPALHILCCMGCPHSALVLDNVQHYKLYGTRYVFHSVPNSPVNIGSFHRDKAFLSKNLYLVRNTCHLQRERFVVSVVGTWHVAKPHCTHFSNIDELSQYWG